MDWNCIIIMVIGFAIAMFGMKKQKLGVAWGQPLAILGAIIAIGAAFWNLTGFFRAGSQGMAREKRYMFLQAKFLGDAVKKAANPQKVAVICDPNLFLDEWGDPLPTPRQSDYLDGIKAALPGADITPYYPEYKVKKPAKMAEGMMNPMPYTMLTSGDYKKIVGKITKAKPDVVINIYSFPMDMKLPAALGMLKGYKTAFLNTSSNEELEYAFKDGGKQCAQVIATVMTKVDAIYDETIPSSDQKAFDRRFALALPENYSQVIKAASGSSAK